MKLGVNLSIDVTKLEKARFYQGKKGTYANLTAFIDTENPGQYGDHGAIRQATSKEERQQGVKLPVVGNVKVFYTAESEAADGYPGPNDHVPGQESNIDDGSIPF